jgi:hypothetical protein
MHREEIKGVSSGIGCLRKNGYKANMKAVLTLKSTKNIVSLKTDNDRDFLGNQLWNLNYPGLWKFN